MIGLLSKRLATVIKTTVPDHPRSENVLAYAISFILNALFIISLSLIVSLFTGKVTEAATILVAYAVLRQVSGGMHLKSGTLCIVVSTLGVTIVSFANFDYSVVLIMNAINVVLAVLFAPSRIEKQTRIPVRFYPLLKIASILIVSINFIINSPILASAFLVQCLTLIKLRR
ncbi:accessory gene regulator ArgB-like protein [Cohnella silvisoli]|uniref:Accessory gene regulator B family protein n=1 Tax=Cohnella silvisoli TaxID=2873699 RepID=A0ABV1KUZ5_9BACL|nr:accessory gene regulator B family protein [Cohnella silvisoli]MCD9023291.1 accessory gene regulator B family protein [Cohnella silvisoli]